MKYLLSLFLFFPFSINILYSQDVDRKYIEVYNYFKGIKQGIEGSVNVSPVIRYISIGTFLNGLDNLGDEIIAAELKDKDTFYKKNYFDPFINKSIDTIFSNAKTYNTYLLFSKPVGNILLVEVRNGHYNLKNLKTPYFGTAMKYLFIFNNQNKIAQVLKDTVVYN